MQHTAKKPHMPRKQEVTKNNPKKTEAKTPRKLKVTKATKAKKPDW
jgi:hypothetical protein